MNFDALDEAARGRLFENLRHEDADHVQRGNYFLVAETLLVVAFTSIKPSTELTSISVSLFGLLISLAWVYSNHHQLRYIRYLQARCKEALPEYALTSLGRPRARVPVLNIFAYFFPTAAIVLWILLVMQVLSH